jgi:YgiT-type zinc finger domain-containing protein
MKCIACGSKTIPGTTTDVTDSGQCLIIVRNTPCHKCSECNEIIYTADVVKRLDEIVKSAKQIMSDFFVVDYNSKAA